MEDRDSQSRRDGGAVVEVQPVWPRLRWVSEVIWRVGLVVAAFLVVGWVLWQLKVVVLPVFVALLLCTMMTGPVVALERRGWSPALATTTVFCGFGVLFAAVVLLIVPPAVDGVSGLDDAATDAVDDLEGWLVDGPLSLERSEVQQYTSDPAGRVLELLEDSSINLSSGARMLGETLAGALLAVVLTFLFLKDGRRFQDWALSHLEGRRETAVRRATARAWGTFGGYLRGAATLGAIEGTVTGVTMWIVGAPLALPVAVLTFAGAFFPIVGAIVAGVIAVLVTFATAGTVPAIVVAVVALLVQQLDGDLLGPVIYGRALDLHPALVLVALTTGGALGGIAGAFVAVPLTAALIGAGQELWKARSVVDEIGPEPVREPLRDTASG